MVEGLPYEQQMKVSDYIISYLESIGVKYVFAITGGMDIHLLDSFWNRENIKYICNQHEQACSMAADAYARISGELGVAISTSGPGATNLLTGCAGAYMDSVPVLYITGQVTTYRLKQDMNVRGFGFQETDVVEVFKPVTKYAVQIIDTEKIRYELEKAVYLAKEGRKGPVLLDIPEDIQRAEIEPDQLKGFEKIKEKRTDNSSFYKELKTSLEECERPVLVLGNGGAQLEARFELVALVNQLQIPVVSTWGARDALGNNPMNIGSFGINGTRYGNFTVQNADLIIVVGARLHTNSTGTPSCDFARYAKKIVIDIDMGEIEKFEKLGLKVDSYLNVDAKIFYMEFREYLKSSLLDNNRYKIWRKTVADWKKKYPIYLENYAKEKLVNPYEFMRELSLKMDKDAVVSVDTGCSAVWAFQSMELNVNQRLISEYNYSSMGYSLPAAIGAAFAEPNKQIICIAGDGGIQMNVQEFATIKKHNLNINTFVFYNRGYGLIQQTQDAWFDKRYEASDEEHGLAFPDFAKIADGYGLAYMEINYNNEIEEVLEQMLRTDIPKICVVKLPINHRIIPRRCAGRPIEECEPKLSDDELTQEMIVPLKE